MRAQFCQYLKRVTAAHFAIVAWSVFATGWRGCERHKVSTVPIEFVVEPAPAAANELPSPPSREPAVAEPVRPVGIARPAPRPAPVSTRRIPVRPESKTPAKRPRLTPQEIEKLLAGGSLPASRAAMPDNDSICLEQIRVTLWNAWNQPSFAEVGASRATARISFDARGRIVGRELVGKSGVEIMDQSVLNALNAIDVIPGLSPDFLARHPSVDVLFKVEQEEGAGL